MKPAKRIWSTNGRVARCFCSQCHLFPCREAILSNRHYRDNNEEDDSLGLPDPLHASGSVEGSIDIERDQLGIIGWSTVGQCEVLILNPLVMVKNVHTVMLGIIRGRITRRNV